MNSGLSLLMTADAIGGVWQYSLDLAGALAPLGVATTLVTLGPRATAAQRSEAADAGVTLVESGLPIDWLCDGPEPIVAAGEQIAAIAAARKVDLVQLNMPTLGARARFSVPVVAVMHGCIATWWDAAHGTTLPIEYRWQRSATHQALIAADAVVAPSATHAGEVARHYGLLHPPLAIHNGRTPLVERRADAPARSLFTAGRLWDLVKDTALLDAVASRLPVGFRAAGATRGPHGETVVPDHLMLLGQLGTTALTAELATRPIFVSAARFEPFGLAVLEAAAAGCPLVLSDIPTFRELWDGAATFVPPGDEDGYVAASEALLDDPMQAATSGDAARARAAQYTPAATAAAMASLYARLVDERRVAA
ncbi:glycosyltransferase family 4 protein [uncultured Sphingomonas sp.]|uniref:glycosyltransferase family 4 protein n=1 Tax=uncultured Sphingomonas sp. TaxID=158754 RepID=UPI0035CBA988